MNNFRRFLKNGFGNCLKEDGELILPLVHPLAPGINPKTNKPYSEGDVILDFLAFTTNKEADASGMTANG